MAGPFELVDVHLEDAVRECHQISAAYGTEIRMRSADVLHVALLDQINADLFVTRDRDQHATALRRGFASQLVY